MESFPSLSLLFFPEAAEGRPGKGEGEQDCREREKQGMVGVMQLMAWRVGDGGWMAGEGNAAVR